MKKLVMAALFLLFGTAMAFAQQEIWFSMGFEFGNSIEHYNDETTYIGSPGFNVNAYGFSEKRDVGMFFHYGYLFPIVTAGGRDLADYGFHMDFMLGPGFRYSFNDNLKLLFGIGIDWIPIFAEYAKDGKDYSKIVNNLGIGADIGIKYDITDYFYISGGVALSYMFYNHTSLYSYETSTHDTKVCTRIIDEHIKGYGMFTAKPYLTLGFNYYYEKRVWGKPKR
ncbi:MAG: porin family protein [Treponema sp.]|jgi:hypothetical protein|nr:porin family protein [Treponema sp.]